MECTHTKCAYMGLLETLLAWYVSFSGHKTAAQCTQILRIFNHLLQSVKLKLKHFIKAR